MKKFYFIIFIFFLNFTVSKSNEPFVVLEYKGDISNDGSSKINRNNKFIKDQNYSTSHLVKDGESLSIILNKYYGNSGLNMRIVQLSLVEINKHAFVRNNPNYLFSGKWNITCYVHSYLIEINVPTISNEVLISYLPE